MGAAVFGEVTAPDTPAASHAALYLKTDGKWYTKNSAGTEVEVLRTGSAGSFTTLACTGNMTVGDASGDSVTHNAATVNYVNGVTLQANGSTALKIETTGEITMPLQSCFFARNGTTRTNVTGNAANYDVPFDTVITDQNSDFSNGSGHGVFTAPVTGKYDLSTLLNVNSASGATRFILILFTSNRNYDKDHRPAATGAQYAIDLTALCADMDAGDTASVQITVSGVGANTAGVSGAATESWFSGGLRC